MSLNTIEEVIEDIRKGRMVIIMDDEDRENEGDLIMAAVLVRPEDINFMARYGRGLICLTLSRERCQKLRLWRMAPETDTKHSTNFTVSIDAAHGVTTGISAQDRSTTIRTAVAPNARAEDLVQPGHIFPIMAQPGGVLTRAGHTEAGCDLARLSGLEPAAVIVEILKDDGTMARRPDLEVFAKEHGLKIGTIADLIRYRTEHERSIERVATCQWTTDFATFQLVAYRDVFDEQQHLALVLGEVRPEVPTLVRVHLQNTLCDLLGSHREDCGWPLRSALRRVAAEGAGIMVVLRHKEDEQGIVRRIRNYHLEEQGQSYLRQEPVTDLRSYGVGAQILSDLGVRKMRVLSAPKKFHGLSGFGLEVTEYVTPD
jgi:3,4-dihydroxy-2-butanone 4-phosphate synthase